MNDEEKEIDRKARQERMAQRLCVCRGVPWHQRPGVYTCYDTADQEDGLCPGCREQACEKRSTENRLLQR